MDLWPIFTYDDNPTKINFIWPITMYKHGFDGTSFAVRPLFHSASEGYEYNLDLIWPFGKYSSEGNGERKAYFWPVSYYSKDSDEKKFYIFPIYYHRDGNEKSYNIIPLLHYSDENFYLFPFYMRMDEYSKRIFSPLFYYGSEPNKKTFWLINAYYKNDRDTKEKTEVFFPVYFRGHDKNSKWLYVVPVGGKYQGKTSSKTMALFPLYLNSKYFKSEDKKEIKSQNTHFLWPLGGHYKNSGKSILRVFPIFKKEIEGQKKSGYAMWPLYWFMNDNEDKYYYTLVPLFHYSKNYISYDGSPPVLFSVGNNTTPEFKEEPVLHGKSFAIFPFYGQGYGGTISDTYKYCCFPLHISVRYLKSQENGNDPIPYKKDYKQETYYRNFCERDYKRYHTGIISFYWNENGKVITKTYPDNKKDTRPSDIKETAYKRSGFALWPLYYYKNFNGKAGHYFIWPFLGRPEQCSSSNNRLSKWDWDFIFPIGEYTQENENVSILNSDYEIKSSLEYDAKNNLRTIGLWPLYKYQKETSKVNKEQLKSRHSFLWPLGKVVVNKNKKNKKFIGQRFFPLYWSEREEDNNKTVQKTKLWPILGYGMDDKGKYSLSLVSPFPALEDPEGYEANWAPYFSLYHIQGVKNEYKESFILYRFYRHYNSASERQLQIWMLYDYLKQKDRIKVNLLKGFLGYEKYHDKKYMRILYFKIPIGSK